MFERSFSTVWEEKYGEVNPCMRSLRGYDYYWKVGVTHRWGICGAIDAGVVDPCETRDSDALRRCQHAGLVWVVAGSMRTSRDVNATLT